MDAAFFPALPGALPRVFTTHGTVYAFTTVVAISLAQPQSTVMNKLDSAFFFQQQALNLRAYRQEVLASNIANNDTPNYKARDFDFAAALKQAVTGRGEGVSAGAGVGAGSGLDLARTSEGHLPGSLTTGIAPLAYRQPVQPSVDGNTVDMDVERAAFSENAVQYQSGVTFITHHLRILQAALAP